MAERNIVPNLETKAQTETRYLHRDNGLKGSGSFVNGNTKLTLTQY